MWLTSNRLNKKITPGMLPFRMIGHRPAAGVAAALLGYPLGEGIRTGADVVAVVAVFPHTPRTATGGKEVLAVTQDAACLGNNRFQCRRKLPSGLKEAVGTQEGFAVDAFQRGSREGGERHIDRLRHSKQTPFTGRRWVAAHPRACPSSTVYSIPHASLFVNRLFCKDSINMD